MDEGLESRDRFFAILDGAFRLGAAAITVHARTVTQRYEGPACWEFLREVKRHAGDRVILGSGDLFTARACLDMLERTGVDGVSVARGAIGNPWIFSQFRALAEGRSLPPPPTVFEQRAVIEEHFARAERIYGEIAAAAGMRKFGIKYSRLHPNHSTIREQFARARSRDEWNHVLKQWYSDDGPGCYPPVEESNPWSRDWVALSAPPIS
jgi:tRNA-dihydrouridine synthase